MKRKFKYSSRIEQYLSNSMGYAERKLFERDLDLNPELTSELNLTITLDDIITRDDIIDLRRKLYVVRKENETASALIQPVSRRKFWLAAASLAILLTFGSAYYYYSKRDLTNEMLFKQYYSSENVINISRSSDANIIEAIIKFQEKDYTHSAILFSQLLERDTDNYAAWYFYGICLIEMQNYGRAIQAFNHIIDDSQNLYGENAEWYISLCLLKNDQLEKAKRQLQKIAASPENSHQSSAKQLLMEISA
jgi:tetratricopeptide (TPR) repeat protein